MTYEHRCSGCGLRWMYHATGSVAVELCGDCWRKVQPILTAGPVAPPPGYSREEFERDRFGQTGDDLRAAREALRGAARPPASPPALEALARELVDRFTTREERHGGCGWCGGLPHSRECLVGRFAAALAVPPEAPHDE
jgi:hypothetical protein